MYIYYTYSVCHQYFKIYHCKSLNYYNIILTSQLKMYIVIPVYIY